MKKAMPDIDTVRKLIGDPQEFSKKMRESDADFRLFMKRHGELRERYPDEYVAFYKGEIHAHGKNLEQVLQESDAKGLPRGRCIVEFLAMDPPLLIL